MLCHFKHMSSVAWNDAGKVMTFHSLITGFCKTDPCSVKWQLQVAILPLCQCRWKYIRSACCCRVPVSFTSNRQVFLTMVWNQRNTWSQSTGLSCSFPVVNILVWESLNIWCGVGTQWSSTQESSETDMQSALRVGAGQWESPPDLNAELTVLVTGETGWRHSLMNN